MSGNADGPLRRNRRGPGEGGRVVLLDASGRDLRAEIDREAERRSGGRRGVLVDGEQERRQLPQLGGVGPEVLREGPAVQVERATERLLEGARGATVEVGSPGHHAQQRGDVETGRALGG